VAGRCVAATHPRRDGVRPRAGSGRGTHREVTVRTAGQAVVGVRVDFGDGHARRIGVRCAAAPEVRARVGHRYRRRGTYTVRVWAVVRPTCASGRRAATAELVRSVRVFSRRVTVPRIEDAAVSDAKCSLERRGLRWRLHRRTGGFPARSCPDPTRTQVVETASVALQRPAAGARVRPGSVVDLFTCVSRGCQ
jgi:hypothetical protein